MRWSGFSSLSQSSAIVLTTTHMSAKCAKRALCLAALICYYYRLFLELGTMPGFLEGESVEDSVLRPYLRAMYRVLLDGRIGTHRTVCGEASNQQDSSLQHRRPDLPEFPFRQPEFVGRFWLAFDRSEKVRSAPKPASIQCMPAAGLGGGSTQSPTLRSQRKWISNRSPDSQNHHQKEYPRQH